MVQLRRYLPSLADIGNHLVHLDLLTTDLFFLFLTLSNVFVTYRILTDVLPYPIFLTWIQMLLGLAYGYVLGEGGAEFSKLAYFPRVEVDMALMKSILVPSLFYMAMLATANLLLARVVVVATLPTILGITVVVHHVIRFLGCGEDYMMTRWKSMGLLVTGFVILLFDHKSFHPELIPYILAAAIAAAIYRAGYLQRLMHMVHGRGNVLHNHQHLVGTIVLLPVSMLFGEIGVFRRLFLDLTTLYNWQLMGCLVTVAAIPFARNVVSNRLIRKTGQGPWRFLEIVSMLGTLIFGLLFFRRQPGVCGIVAVLVTVCGRIIGALDVLRNASEVEHIYEPPSTYYINQEAEEEMTAYQPAEE